MDDMKKIIVVTVITALAVLVVAGSIVYWSTGRGASAVRVKDVSDAQNNRFVSLDKVVVMLRAEETIPEMHYIMVDLVFRTSEKQEADVKGQLPFLKSVAVRSLAQLNLTKATAMSIDDYQQLLDKAYAITFVREGRVRPFSELMVGKLIIE